jgi:hypothetical protein
LTTSERLRSSFIPPEFYPSIANTTCPLCLLYLVSKLRNLNLETEFRHSNILHACWQRRYRIRIVSMIPMNGL